MLLYCVNCDKDISSEELIPTCPDCKGGDLHIIRSASGKNLSSRVAGSTDDRGRKRERKIYHCRETWCLNEVPAIDMTCSQCKRRVQQRKSRKQMKAALERRDLKSTKSEIVDKEIAKL